MGKDTGFLEYKRVDNGDVPVSVRIKGFEEFHTPLDDEARRQQAARCMNCGVPFCQSAMKLNGMITGCPLHNLIPEWNDQIYSGHLEHAFHRLIKTSNFPEFTGRVCPALCEKACINGEYGESVSIHDNELYLIEKAFEMGYIKPRKILKRSGKKIAVVGSGPAGLAVADELNHRGHSVVIYERDDRIGGLLMYGIPNMKLDKKVIDRRVKLMEEEGIEFKTGVNVGEDIDARTLIKDYDAVVLCCGAKQARGLKPASPEKFKGVHFAVDFLKENTRALLECRAVDTGFDAKDKNVIVVGGGDTGNDCIGTAIRRGCKSVIALEMMSAPPKERAKNNPWPQYPKTLKVDYAHEEAIELFGSDPRIYETTVKECVADKKGNLKKVVTVKVKFENGAITEIEGSEKTYECSLLLIAAGFTGCEQYTPENFKVSLNERGVVKTEEESYKTDAESVFCAGDMHTGQSLVVRAIAEGRLCAREVDRYLMGYTTL